MRVTLTDKYSGRSLNLRVKESMWANVETYGRWAFLTDYQRRRIEAYFGKINAYYTSIDINQ